MAGDTGYAHDSDEQLVRMLGAGDSEALRAIAERHGQPVYSLALRILGEPGWAEEVLQDVLLRLWEKPERYDPSRGDLRRWLLAVTHHAAIDGLRSRRGKARARSAGPEALDLDLVVDRGEDPSESAWKSVRAESVRAAVAELPAGQREAIELVYYGGLTQAEVAARTGQPLGTIKTRVWTGLRRLRESLAQMGLVE